MSKTKPETMTAFINTLRIRLQEELLPIHQQAGQQLLSNVEKIIMVLQASMQRIKEFLDGYEFARQQEEIDFFKTILPEFQSQLIYHVQLSIMERRRPEGHKSILEKYYTAQLSKITAYFNDHAAFYEYYRAGCTHLDDKYYVRGTDGLSLARGETFSFVLDQRYCTTGSFILSTILANRSLLQYLDEQLEALAGAGQPAATKDFGVKWTDTRAALEEITYAFYFKGSFNNGQVEIRQLYEALCSYFGVTPGNIYKSKQDFYGRSNISAYLDMLSKRYKGGMNDTDGHYNQK